MPQGIDGRASVGITTPPATTPQGSPPPPSGSRPAPSAGPQGLTARNPSTSSSIAPRQKGPQAPAMGVPAQPQAPAGQALGVPVYAQPYMAPYHAAPPMTLIPRPQIGGAFGGGGILQMVRNAVQQIMQFPQQLHQLAQQASHYPPPRIQQALNAARPFGHGPHAGGMRPPAFVPRSARKNAIRSSTCCSVKSM